MNAAKNRTFEKEGQSDGLVMDAKGRLYFSGVTTGVVTSNPFCLLFDDDPQYLLVKRQQDRIASVIRPGSTQTPFIIWTQ